MRKLAIAVVALGTLAWLAGTAVAQVDDGFTTYRVALTGAQETQAADPDGSGTAVITINTGTDQVCFDITMRRIVDPNRAHIHPGARGVAGGIAIGFWESAGGLHRTGCVTDADADAVAANPSAFYVNVHNSQFPAGALRGQLHPSS